VRPHDDAATAVTAAAVTAVWRVESTRLVAALTRMTRDLALAEDLTQDALVAALDQWPRQGIPTNPAAWLMAVAKRRAVDHCRRAETERRRTVELGEHLQEVEMPDLAAMVDHIEDDVLRLMFLTCHPLLSPQDRAALTLRLVGGLSTDEIARAFLVADATMGQRLSRARRTLVQAKAQLELPVGAERTARLDDVTAVVYLIFNEGYSATAGPTWMRSDLCGEALRLARLLAALADDDAEVLALQALLELQASRTGSRAGPDGEPVLLEDQDRSRWDQLLIRRGLAALARSQACSREVGYYGVQARIAACHARARTAAVTDWAQIAAWYDVLSQSADNPVVEVNRAVAHGRAHGPRAGLAILDDVAAHPSLARSQLLPSVRGDLLARAGRHDEAEAQFRLAATLTGNDQERRLLLRRAREQAGPA
jgi:RNA polymerase sigma factor (sigma-70 family)